MLRFRNFAQLRRKLNINILDWAEDSWEIFFWLCVISKTDFFGSCFDWSLWSFGHWFSSERSFWNFSKNLSVWISPKLGLISKSKKSILLSDTKFWYSKRNFFLISIIALPMSNNCLSSETSHEISWEDCNILLFSLLKIVSVSYTHLTLPTSPKV